MDGNVNLGQYQIRLRKGDWELEISAPDKEFVLHEWERLGVIPTTNPLVVDASPVKEGPSERPIGNGNNMGLRTVKPQTLNEFFLQFKLQTNLEKTLVLGYWCELKLQQPGFTSDDILAKYKEAKETPPKNIRRDLNSLVSKSFLLQNNKSPDGDLVYELTNTGIHEVEQKLPGQG
jgi:hypothetical protein